MPKCATTTWQFFRAFRDRGPAEVLAVQLEGEGVPTKIGKRALENAIEQQYCVLVAKSLAHCARWITVQLPPSDEELDFLATGKLPGQE